MLRYRILGLLESMGLRTRFAEDRAAIEQSGLFDADWYRVQLDAGRTPKDPVVHYLVRGARKGLDPHPLFDSDFYATDLPRFLGETVNPLADYQAIGDEAGKDPCAWVDVDWYRAFHQVAPPPGVTTLREYWETGQFAGRSPHPLFEASWYGARYAGEMTHDNPVADFIHDGLGKGRVPHRALDGDSRIGRDPAAIRAAVDEALATLDPEGPKRTSRRSFGHEAEEAFLQELAAKVEKTGVLAAPPKVSIVMPTRNRAAMLPKAIGSVLAQDYANWELLVVDDGSEDDTAAVVQGFADPRIRYIRSDGSGAAAARNIGLAAATGELFAYLDSDNAWTPIYLRTLVGFLLVEDLDLAYSGMRLESEDGVRYRGRGFKYQELVRLNYVDLNALVHRRALTYKHGDFDTSLRRMMDWDLVLRYARDARVKYAPFIGVIYDERKGGDRITTRESIAWRFEVTNRYLIDWPALQTGSGERDKDLVSIVIPVYGKFELTNGCLESLFRHRDGPRFEIVLVNNRSDHATLANLMLWEKARADVRVVASWTNLNFALGCNFGFAHTRGDVVVFLNNDTLATEGWLAPLVEELADGKVGAVQPKLLYPDGTVQSYGAAFSEAGVISHMLYRGVPDAAPEVNRRRELQAIHGACLAVRAGDFARLRGFDPQFINGQEDIDFCLRLTAETGRPVVVQPRSRVIHLEGKTRSGRNPHNHRNRRVFVNRWQGRIKADDRRIYQEDGFVVAGYEPDSAEMVRQGIACFSPRLVRPE